MFRDAMANKRDAVKEADELVTQVFITCKCLNGHFSEHEWRAANESAIREFLPVAHESFHQGTARDDIKLKFRNIDLQMRSKVANCQTIKGKILILSSNLKKNISKLGIYSSKLVVN